VENNNTPILYTEEQLMARLKFFIGICLSLTLFGIVFVVLYSLIFVTQPLNAISPIDQKFFELIIPIATFLTGTLSGIMLASGDKDAQKQALTAANAGWARTPTPAAPTPSTPSFGAPAASGFGSVPLGGNSVSTFGGNSSQFTATPTASFGVPPAFGTPSAPAEVTTGFGGKKAVPDFPQPIL
jgi:hypothetical protein